ncbi:hypothetical protein FM020_07660 [Acinetobacter tandoii]|uniref:hypothetical protein n=1 Tax=Acinetobacter kanungonis TaxID=2699469 RepID=UPI0011582A41|nr:hypothetical protein [Acinetobacter kanungonis]NCI80098.1 hypothetical protein [Acinetobacter kanungonis]QDK97768.1 hypothetical protein FM020_07660 [Acinetobacter tandoii]
MGLFLACGAWMLIRVNDVIVNTDLIQYMEIKSEPPFIVMIHFNVGSVKRLKFKNLIEQDRFLEDIGLEQASYC